MSSAKSLIGVMDSHSEKMNQTPLVEGLGENGHAAHTWSGDIKEKLLQVFFQLTRVEPCWPHLKEGNTTSNVINEFIDIVKHVYDNNLDEYKSLCTRMISQTRDIIDGKGEYDLAYRMMLEFALVNTTDNTMAEKTKQLIYYMVNPLPIEGNSHPHGSWKDIKKFLGYVYDRKEQLRKTETDIDEEVKTCNYLIAYCLNLYVIQLKSDLEALNESRPHNISLCAKWVPREKTKYSWIFGRLARAIFNAETNDNCGTKQSYKKFRRLIASLSRAIDTLEIKQCANRYQEIEFSKVPSVAMTRQKNAFMNKGRHRGVKSVKEDRIICAEKFAQYIANLATGKTKVNAKRNNITDLVEAALNVTNEYNKDDDEGNMMAKLLDAQWNDFVSTIGELPNMVAMVDVSGSMAGNAILAAIGLGLCVASKSTLGQRLLTFSASPSWINLESCNGSFTKMVEMTSSSDWGMNTDFYKAARLILDRIIENKLDAETASNMVMVVFSDMQIDQACRGIDSSASASMMHNITAMYRAGGIMATGKPYNPPHIVFWNLRSTDNFPNLSTTENTTMISGYSPQMLNAFIKYGVEGLKEITPYKMMVDTLDNPRYDVDAFVNMGNNEWFTAMSNKNTEAHREYIRTHVVEPAPAQ